MCAALFGLIEVCSTISLLVHELREHLRAVKENVEIAGARDFDPGDAGDAAQTFGQFCGDFARVLLLACRRLDPFGQFKGDGEGEVAEFGARRHFGSGIVELQVEIFAHQREQSLPDLSGE